MLFYSFYISRLVFEILRLKERKKSVKSAILDIHGYARFTSQQGSRDFFFFNQTLLRACNLIFYSNLNFDVLTSILVMFGCNLAALDVVLYCLPPVVTSC